ncbi:MAG: alpha/beta hydrolase [Devosia sp.]
MKVRIGDIDVHYEEVGEGRPLLIHHGGGAVGCAQWALEQYEPLFGHRKHWRRIYIDQMGHGETPIPSWARGMDDTVDLTLAFMDAIAPGERFTLSGVSWGGYVARGVLHHRAEQIDGFFIWVPNYKYDGSDPAIPAHHAFTHEPGFDSAAAPGQEWLGNFMIDQTATGFAEARRVIYAGAAKNGDRSVFDLGPGKGFSFDPEDLPKPFPGPALILCGRQDNVTGYELPFLTRNTFPRGTHVVLDRCGHLMGVDQPLLLSALANEWLDRVEEYVGLNQLGAG